MNSVVAFPVKSGPALLAWLHDYFVNSNGEIAFPCRQWKS